MVSYKISNNKELKLNDSSFNINHLFYRDLFNHICRLENDDSKVMAAWIKRDQINSGYFQASRRDQESSYT